MLHSPSETFIFLSCLLNCVQLTSLLELFPKDYFGPPKWL